PVFELAVAEDSVALARDAQGRYPLATHGAVFTLKDKYGDQAVVAANALLQAVSAARAEKAKAAAAAAPKKKDPEAAIPTAVIPRPAPAAQPAPAPVSAAAKKLTKADWAFMIGVAGAGLAAGIFLAPTFIGISAGFGLGFSLAQAYKQFRETKKAPTFKEAASFALLTAAGLSVGYFWKGTFVAMAIGTSI